MGRREHLESRKGNCKMVRREHLESREGNCKRGGGNTWSHERGLARGEEGTPGVTRRELQGEEGTPGVSRGELHEGVEETLRVTAWRETARRGEEVLPSVMGGSAFEGAARITTQS